MTLLLLLFLLLLLVLLLILLLLVLLPLLSHLLYWLVLLPPLPGDRAGGEARWPQPGPGGAAEGHQRTGEDSITSIPFLILLLLQVQTCTDSMMKVHLKVNQP